MKTKIALITTTINVPHVVQLHAENVPPNCELEIVVAGDVTTPPSARPFVEDIGGTYVGVGDDDISRRWATSAAVGARSIQRRNVALLHALTLGPDVVVTVDDDNLPVDPELYLGSFVEGFSDPSDQLTRSSTGWFNPGYVLEPPVVHRGFPINQRHNRRSYTTGRRNVTMAGGGWPPRVGVVAGLWFGDPDVDAIERIVDAPRVTGLRSNAGYASSDYGTVLEVGTWAPFNTQNTAYAWAVAPLMQCLVGVGRYDDIWMSYIARVVMDDLGYHVRYGVPITHQTRNEHDLVRDLEDEFYGYRHTGPFVDRLRQINFDNDLFATPLGRLAEVYDRVADLLPDRTNEVNRVWLDDVQVAVDEGRRRREDRIERAVVEVTDVV